LKDVRYLYGILNYTRELRREAIARHFDKLIAGIYVYGHGICNIYGGCAMPLDR
jgi:hypothetical protein